MPLELLDKQEEASPEAEKGESIFASSPALGFRSPEHDEVHVTFDLIFLAIFHKTKILSLHKTVDKFIT